MLTESVIFEQVVNYGRSWGVEIHDLWLGNRRYNWRLFSRHLLEAIVGFRAEHGDGTARLCADPLQIQAFEYFPASDRGAMLPPWGAHPGAERWNQGVQEAYYHKWFDWYAAQSPEARQKYQNRFPPPKDFLLVPWDRFYIDREKEIGGI
jgi:hypothetical protein